MRLLVIAAALVGFTVAAAAQTDPAPAPSAPPPAASEPSAAPPAAGAAPTASTPPVDCRAQARSKGLRGQEARDAVRGCVQEQRLACTKEAAEKKLAGTARRDFVRACAGRPGKADESKKG